MPGGDGTGPMGQGAMTGRAMGYCAGNDAPGFSTGGGRGLGRGRGGWGRRNMFYATGQTGWQRRASGQQAFGQPPVAATPPTPPTEDDAAALRREVTEIKEALATLTERLGQLDK